MIKRVFFCFLLVFLGFSAKAQPSELCLFSTDSLIFSVYLNAVLANETPSDSVCIRDVIDYYPTLFINFSDTAVFDIHVPFFLKPDFRSEYLVQIKNDTAALVWIADKQLFYKTSKDLVATDSLSADSVIIITPHDCSSALAASEFSEQLFVIRETDSDNDKLAQAIEYLHVSCYSAAQVRDLTGEMDSDWARLFFCKVVYRYIVDKERISLVYDSFEVADSILEMERFITNFKN